MARTKTKIIPQEKYWKNASFDNAIWSPAVGRSGGFVILWKSHQLTHEMIALEIQLPRIIVVKYTNLNKDISFVIFFVCGPPDDANKNVLWETLSELIRQSQLPCIVIGDMNEINCGTNKGGVDINVSRFRRITEFKTNC